MNDRLTQQGEGGGLKSTYEVIKDLFTERGAQVYFNLRLQRACLYKRGPKPSCEVTFFIIY